MSTFDWDFKPKFRAKALGWSGSAQAVQRLKSAAAELKKAAKTEPVRAAEGAVYLFTRIWPALEQVDGSSGALGAAVTRTQHELIPVIATAPAEATTRSRWLERLWEAMEEDGVGYLDPTGERWGEICASIELASMWADRLIPNVRSAWTDTRYRFAKGASACLSCLLFAGRHQDLWALLDLQRTAFWPYRQFGFEALAREGRIDDALVYAEASAGHQRDPGIDSACEKLLIAAGRSDEAYAKYAIRSNAENSTGLNAFRAVAKKYPDIPPARILLDLAAASHDCGRYFAAAKDAGLLDLALKFAVQGSPDPSTLSRACRDFLDKDPAFALAIGQIAMQRYLDGFGYEVAPWDWADCYQHYAAASERMGESPEALAWVKRLAETKQQKSLQPWAESLLREIRKGLN